MANLSTHSVASTTESWNWRLDFSTQECQMNYLSDNQIKQENCQRKHDLTTSILSSGELSASSTESQVKKKKKQEKRKKKKEKKRVREERRRKKEKRRRKGNIEEHAEDCINPSSPAYKRLKRANASERFARNAHDDSKSKDIATWVALRAARTKLIDDVWVDTSTFNSQNGEVSSSNDLYEAISSDEDSLLDFTPTPSEANLTLPSNDQSESEVAASVKKLSREELEKVAIRHIAMCEKYTKTELELDMFKGREETFHSVILELNQEVIKLKSMIPPSKTIRSIGVQMELDSSSGQQNSSSIPYPFLSRIKIEPVEGNSDKESISSNENSSNNLHTHPSLFGGSVVLTPASPIKDNQIHSVVKQEKS